jgi:CDP-diglyceride synthetase
MFIASWLRKNELKRNDKFFGRYWGVFIIYFSKKLSPWELHDFPIKIFYRIFPIKNQEVFYEHTPDNGVWKKFGISWNFFLILYDFCFFSVEDEIVETYSFMAIILQLLGRSLMYQGCFFCLGLNGWINKWCFVYGFFLLLVFHSFFVCLKRPSLWWLIVVICFGACMFRRLLDFKSD